MAADLFTPIGVVVVASATLSFFAFLLSVALALALGGGSGNGRGGILGVVLESPALECEVVFPLPPGEVNLDLFLQPFKRLLVALLGTVLESLPGGTDGVRTSPPAGRISSAW